MPRYFIEVSYRGTAYSGFQVQENADTVQAQVEKAFATIHRRPVTLTGSSRTDTGVHALQNYFHFDEADVHPALVYKMNALLPPDIAIRNMYRMPDDAHSRFDATSREYFYRVHRFKNPFLVGTSFFFPYKIDLVIMQEAASVLREQTNFFAFAKTNSQVKNFNCRIFSSEWTETGEGYKYNISGNRFLRGMVRLLTATMLKLGRGQLTMETFHALFQGIEKAGYSVPPQGLFLRAVNFPENYFPAPVGPFTGF